MDHIYLDYNATTPIDPQVAESMLPYIHERYGNPSSTHVPGVAAKNAVDNARRQLAGMLGAKDDEVIFTSGGTESNNHAIKGVFGAYRDKGNHMITSSVEHPAVIEVCRYLEQQGGCVTYLSVDEFGMVAPQQVADAITPQTVLVSIMHANNAVGTIEPLEKIGKITKERGVLLHADCAQSVGKIPVTVDALGVDLLSIAGHKVYAPKGIGALYIRPGVRLEKLMHGANHEMGWRAGTENVIEMVGLGQACELVKNNLTEYHRNMQTMRDRLAAGMGERFAHIQINGHPPQRLPNTLSASFRGMEANIILDELQGVFASAGAACHSDYVEVSSVLEAMQVPMEYAMGTLRFSVGRYTTEQEIDRALEEITRAVSKCAQQKA